MPISKTTQRRADGEANLQAALDYQSLDWPVLAECPPDHAGMNERHRATCDSSGKRPWHRWKQFQPDGSGRIPTTVEIYEWWRMHPSSNVGLALGAIGRIDIEGPEARHRLVEVSSGDLPETLMFSSGRSDGTGEGWLYALPPEARLRTKKEGLLLGGELRLQALGAQTVLPPSRHPSRRLYTWKPGYSPKECRIAPAPAWLLNKLRDAKSKENNRPPRKGHGKPADIALALAALVGLDPRRCRDYDSWLKVGMALHSVDDGDAMLAAWDEWSMQSPDNYDDGACECKWASFNHEAGGITLGSLIHWAQEDGWTVPAADKKRREPTNAEILLTTALAESELWHTSDLAYATIQREGHREHWPLRGKVYKQWLAKQFYDATQKSIGSQTMQDVLGTLEGKATFDGPEYPSYLRVAGYEGKIYIDLADDAWRAIEVDVDGWHIVDDPPVRFIRPRGMFPLPEPEPTGSLTELRPFVNVEDEHWPLILAYVVAAFRPRGPFPNLQLDGEQGSAKTTVTKVLRSLVDPNKCSVRATPDNERDLAIAAQNGWLCAYDNLSYISPKISDALCRLSTGGGFGTRELFSDDEEKVFDHMRPVIMNGIEEVGTRSDLMDRSLLIELPVIDDDHRKPENVFWREFEMARPHIFGALLTAVSTALRRLPEIEARDARWPRMADFAQWVTAAEPALGLEQEDGKDDGAFLKAYEANREEADQLALENSPIPEPLVSLLVRSGGLWEGRSQPLHDAISNGLPDSVTKNKKWPKASNALSGILRRLSPNLRKSGVAVEQNGKDWRFELKKDHPRYLEAMAIKERQAQVNSRIQEEVAASRRNGDTTTGPTRTDGPGRFWPVR